MSFKNLNKEKLLFAAEFAGVNVEQENTKAEIIAALEEVGFSWSNYQKFVEAEDRVAGEALKQAEQSVTPHHEVPRQGTAEEPFATPSAEAVKFDDNVLLKMERQNGTFDILGYRFTKKQPFVLMSSNEAQKVIDLAETMGGGFRIATPKEAKEYFG